MSRYLGEYHQLARSITSPVKTAESPVARAQSAHADCDRSITSRERTRHARTVPTGGRASSGARQQWNSCAKNRVRIRVSWSRARRPSSPHLGRCCTTPSRLTVSRAQPESAPDGLRLRQPKRERHTSHGIQRLRLMAMSSSGPAAGGSSCCNRHTASDTFLRFRRPPPIVPTLRAW
ncbi:MAG: hypothetical protein ACI841_005076, partial [Planctomycetota bacterium]